MVTEQADAPRVLSNRGSGFASSFSAREMASSASSMRRAVSPVGSSPSVIASEATMTEHVARFAHGSAISGYDVATARHWRSASA